MNGEHSASPRRGERRKRNPPRDMKRMLRIGWIALGLMLALSVGLLIRLALYDPAPAEPAPPSPAVEPGPAGSAFSGPAATPSTDEGRGGRWVKITGFDCDYEPPGEITVGRLTDVDLTEIAGQLCDNARAAGWGELIWSVTDGTLQLRARDFARLSAADYEKQTAFLAGPQPENMARTFLENCGLVLLLKNYGLSLGLEAENNNGEISFYGNGSAPGAECSARFDFLFTGAFNQALIRATYLADAVTTDKVVKPRKAAEDAVTWTPGAEGQTRVTDVELRHIRGIPFYVFTCGDGTAAYALAVEEEVLSQVPGAEEIYGQLLSGGIRENTVVPGVE